jgi:hypothetical protein
MERALLCSIPAGYALVGIFILPPCSGVGTCPSGRPLGPAYGTWPLDLPIRWAVGSTHQIYRGTRLPGLT